MYRALFVPGLGLDAAAWQPTIDALQRAGGRYDATVTALPAYGGPARRHQDLTPHELATELDGVLEDQEDWILCGHSASCQVVAHAAARRPARSPRDR